MHILYLQPPQAHKDFRTLFAFRAQERFPKHALPFASRADLTHTAFVAEQTLEYIERHHDEPFLCIAGFYSPHSPWVAPGEFIDRYDPDKVNFRAWIFRVAKNVLLEAMACGVPVLANKACGNSEILSASQGGILAAMESPSELAKIVSSLVTNREYLEKKGIAARETVSMHFSIEEMTTNYSKLYHRVAYQ